MNHEESTFLGALCGELACMEYQASYRATELERMRELEVIAARRFSDVQLRIRKMLDESPRIHLPPTPEMEKAVREALKRKKRKARKSKYTSYDR